MDQLLDSLPKSPLIAFTILLLVIVTVPPIFERRLRLPGLVGLLIAGVCLGSDGLGLLSHKTETMKLLSDIGKIYLMFVAGLEIDLADFRRTKDRSLSFGLATFLVPMITGTLVGQVFGMSLNASILIGSLLASHTLLGYPIVNRLGVARSEPVAVTIGATIFTDIGALLVLAICVSVHAGDFSATSLVTQLGALALYVVVVLFGFDWAGKEYFRRSGNDEGNQFLFVLLAVFLASVGAQAINIEQIVGAFLAGLAVNDAVGHGPVEEKVVFVGSTLFIPFFFVDMGLLLNVSGFVKTLTTQLPLTLAIVVGLISSKFLAAFVIKLIYRYRRDEFLTMWSLSLPQVAATLAATIAGFNAGILPESVLNAVIVMMLVTSIMGPVLTARFARTLSVPQAALASGNIWGLEQEQSILPPDSPPLEPVHRFKVVVPVSNPHTEQALIKTGALLAHHESGIVIPLSIAKANVQMDAPEMTLTLQQSRRLMQNALEVTQAFQVEATPLVRIADDVARGICRTAREQDASLIVMGWSKTTGLRARLFGNVIDSVFWSSHCPVAVMRLLDDPMHIHRILVPMKAITPQALRAVRLAQLLADENQAQVTLLRVWDRKASQAGVESFEAELSEIMTRTAPRFELAIKSIRHDDIAEGIIMASHSFDLIVLRSMRRRTAGGLAVSDVTTQALSEITSSIVLFGEPYSVS